MTPEDVEIIRYCLQTHEYNVIHWYDILALMVVGYWGGNFIADFTWWVF